jgi:DNA polymerase I
MGAAVTATGRKVIKYTEEVVNDYGYEVIYGDTDSVMLEIGDISSSDVNGDVDLPEELQEKYPEMGRNEAETLFLAVKKGFELEERINEAYDGFAEERLNATEHRFEIEFEKLYRRFFQAGRKKRYAGSKIWMR